MFYQFLSTNASASSFVMWQLSINFCAARKNGEMTVLVSRSLYIIQSFSPDDKITPEEAHKIGMEFMEKLFSDRFAFVCATHIDKNHIHNHFAICSAPRAMTGWKLYDDLSLLHKMQKISDEICRKNSLHVMDKKRRKSKTYKEWLEDKTTPTGSKKHSFGNLSTRLFLNQIVSRIS